MLFHFFPNTAQFNAKMHRRRGRRGQLTIEACQLFRGSWDNGAATFPSRKCTKTATSSRMALGHHWSSLVHWQPLVPCFPTVSMLFDLRHAAECGLRCESCPDSPGVRRRLRFRWTVPVLVLELMMFPAHLWKASVAGYGYRYL